MSLSRLNEQGVNSIYTMTTEDNIDEIIEIISTIFDDIDSFLTKERFNVIKDSITVQLKKGEINRYQNVNTWINPKGWSLDEIIDDIEYLEILAIAEKYFNINKCKVYYKQFRKFSYVNIEARLPVFAASPLVLCVLVFGVTWKSAGYECALCITPSLPPITKPLS
jgi:hypothetical protein